MKYHQQAAHEISRDSATTVEFFPILKYLKYMQMVLDLSANTNGASQ